jgi:hypothetical protein
VPPAFWVLMKNRKIQMLSTSESPMADNMRWLALVPQVLNLSSKKCLAWELLLALTDCTETSTCLTS